MLSYFFTSHLFFIPSSTNPSFRILCDSLLYNSLPQIISQQVPLLRALSVSLCLKFKRFGKVHHFKEHDGRLKPVREDFLADVTNREYSPSGFSCKLHGPTFHSRNGMDLFVVRAIQSFDRLKSFLYSYRILGSEHSPVTLGELLHLEYYICDPQAMGSDNRAESACHRQSRADTNGRTVEQARGADERIFADEKS